METNREVLACYPTALLCQACKFFESNEFLEEGAHMNMVLETQNCLFILFFFILIKEYLE